MADDENLIAGLDPSDWRFDGYEPHIKVVTQIDDGWTRVVPHYDAGTGNQDYRVEVARRVDSGYVRYDDEKSGTASVALPLGYELYSYRYDELSQNGTVNYSVESALPDAVKVTYTVKSDGSLVDQTRGWLSIKVFVRGRILQT